MEKTDNICEKMGIFSWEGGKYKKEIMEILDKNKIVLNMKNAFDRLIRRLDIAEERVRKFEDVAIKIT